MASTPLEKSADVVIANTQDLIEDFSALYLNQKFSDVILDVNGQKLHSHKVILAARSEYFENLLYPNDLEELSIPQLEVTIENVSPNAFLMLLKYIYTGSMVVSTSDVDLAFEVMIVADKYVKGLKSKLADKVKYNLSLDNVIPILNIACQHNVEDMKESCYLFLDGHASEILTNNFTKLAHDSLVGLLARNSFSVEEVEIFKAVLKWREVNEDYDNLAIKSVRLSQMTAEEIVSVVRPTKLFSDDVLLTALTEILYLKSKTTSPRAKLLADVNIATPEYKAEVLHGLHRPDVLLTGNRDVDLWISHDICPHNGITVKLDKPYVINHIDLRLYDKDDRYYNYYVEVSSDQKAWKKVIDYTGYPCISYQSLYFEPEKVQYVRVVGTYNKLNTQFHLIYLEAYYSTSVPMVVQQMIYPLQNVATIKTAKVIEGSKPGLLLNNNADGSKGYTDHVIGSGHITIQLAQPYMISTMKIRLWDQDSRFYRYYVETSIDKVNWEMAVDRRDGQYKSWQTLTFKVRPVVFIRITGTHNSANNVFHLFHFECCYNNTIAPNKTASEPK